jgi:hypothetical protein
MIMGENVWTLMSLVVVMVVVFVLLFYSKD